MTLQEYLIDSYNFLEEIGLKPFLIGSTLLQIARTGKFEERHILDREINIGCLAENLTKERLSRIHNRSSYYRTVEDEETRLVFFASPENPHELSPALTATWEIEPGFTLLGAFYEEGDNRVEHMGNGNTLSWPKQYLESFEEVEFMGTRFRVPHPCKDWLEHYFGADWITENLKWTWSVAGNRGGGGN